MSEQSRQSQATERQGGRLIVLTGPTAVGKGHRRDGVTQGSSGGLGFGLRHHARSTAGERDGVNYWFISEPEFLRRQETGSSRNRRRAWHGALRHAVGTRT